MKGHAMPCCEPDNTASNLNTAPSAQVQRMAHVFAALANPARIEILQHISQHRHCKCKEITDVLPLAQSTVSQHLKVLIEAELIICETKHPSSHYQVNDELLKDVAASTGKFMNACCQSHCC